VTRSGFLPARVVHLHPTRACNLACLHCYSDSSPQVQGALDVSRVLDALALLRDEGYEILSISGGEPLVYRPLAALAEGAAALGYRVHLITNGILLTPARLDELATHLTLIGVSLDGNEALHNTVRARGDAYRHARRALDLLSDRRFAHAIIYAASAPSLEFVPWAFELARDLGARLLHLRPLAPEGRARTMDNAWTLRTEDCSRLFLLAELLDAIDPRAPRVQVDLVRSSALAEGRAQFALLDPDHPPRTLSDAVNPLVIDADGRCYPFTYGIDEALVLTNITHELGSTSFRLAPEQAARLAAVLDTAFRRALDESLPFLDWFAYLTRVSRDPRSHTPPDAPLSPSPRTTQPTQAHSDVIPGITLSSP